MKVLVIQLARLGDIFQTWPTLNALHRAGCEVHMLVRPRFREAAEGIEAVHKIHEFRTDEVLGPVLSQGAAGTLASMKVIDKLMTDLDGESFDRIINLSFSPLSSWLTFDLEMRSFVRGKALMAVGYTRHADGALAIPDDASAYFFAQVGSRAATAPGETVNRLPLARIFAVIAQGAVNNAELTADDWKSSIEEKVREEILPTREFVAIHIGASDQSKTLDVDGWTEIAARILRRTRMDVVLLGSNSETKKADAILAGLSAQKLPERRILSNVGKTGVSELFSVVKRASILVGGDSALIHVASLTGTRVLCLSSRTVSHWETGPLSKDSRIIIYGGAGPSGEAVIQEAISMLEGGPVVFADRVVAGPMEDVAFETSDGHADFVWSLTSSIYLGTPCPETADRQMTAALTNWLEVQEVERSQLEALGKIWATKGVDSEDARTVSSVIDRVDEITSLITASEPRLAPIERWWATEKVRMGPQDRVQLLARCMALNEQLGIVLNRLRPKQAEVKGDRRDGLELDI